MHDRTDFTDRLDGACGQLCPDGGIARQWREVILVAGVGDIHEGKCVIACAQPRVATVGARLEHEAGGVGAGIARECDAHDTIAHRGRGCRDARDRVGLLNGRDRERWQLTDKGAGAGRCLGPPGDRVRVRVADRRCRFGRSGQAQVLQDAVGDVVDAA